MSLAALRASLQNDLKFEEIGPGKMRVTNRSLFSDKVNTMEMDIIPQQVDAWKGGMLIQNAFPNLTPGEREFIMTGAFGKEWDDTFPDE